MQDYPTLWISQRKKKYKLHDLSYNFGSFHYFKACTEWWTTICLHTQTSLQVISNPMTQVLKIKDLNLFLQSLRRFKIFSSAILTSWTFWNCAFFENAKKTGFEFDWIIVNENPETFLCPKCQGFEFSSFLFLWKLHAPYYKYFLGFYILFNFCLSWKLAFKWFRMSFLERSRDRTHPRTFDLATRFSMPRS